MSFLSLGLICSQPCLVGALVGFAVGEPEGAIVVGTVTLHDDERVFAVAEGSLCTMSATLAYDDN